MSDSADDYFEDGSDDEGLNNFDTDEDEYEPPKADSGKGKIGEFSYRSYKPKEMEAEIAKDMADLCALLGLQTPIANVLLRHFRWNKDRLIEKYMECSDSVLRSTGEPLPTSPARPKKRARLTPEAQTCAICFDSMTSSEDSYKERCGHEFCRDCWRDYATCKVKDEGQCDFTCMQEGCGTKITDEAMQELVLGDVYQRYLILVLESLVRSSPYLKFCPSPGCDEIISCQGASSSNSLTQVPIVHCSQEHAFCFGCGLDFDHRPCICPLARIWLKDARDDSGSYSWIKANTKECPKCHNATEKNGGCNRIYCGSCHFEWCWMCQRDWNVHGYNGTCNAYQEKAVIETQDAQSIAKAKLEKWLFYYDRYNNHEVSAKLDAELVESTEERIKEVQDASNLSWIEARFMKHAVDELTKCRTTLKWSYAMAFFIQAGNMKTMFEDVQADLEKAVEALSQMLQENIMPDTVHSLRQRMIDKTTYVQKRRDIVIEDSAFGLQEERWKWTVSVE